MQRKVDIAILGAGTAGLAALAQIKHSTDNYVLINGGELGTTCARVGCMPSKVLVQIAEDYHRRHIFTRHGIEGDEHLTIDVPEAMEHVRHLRDIFVDRVLAGTTDQMEDDYIEGFARFVAPNELEVNGQRITANKVIIATGSTPIVPADWQAFGDRVLTSDTIFEQATLPGSVAVIGLGVVGLELGQAMARMGSTVTGIDRLTTLGGITDPEVNRCAIELLSKEFELWLGGTAELQPDGEKIAVRCGDREVVVDKVMASMGRRPNLQDLGLEKLDVELDERGIPVYDPATMQIGELPIFIAGDVDGDRGVLHEAGDEGRIAARNASAATVSAYRRRVPLTITFTDPNIAMVGQRFGDLDPEQIAVGTMRLGPLGRALIMGRNKGILRVYAARHDGRLLGAEMACPGGEHLAQLLALALQQRLTVVDLLRLPFYHPTLEEALQSALKQLRDELYPAPPPYELSF